MQWRRLGAFSVYGLAAFGLLHLASTALFAWRTLPQPAPARPPAAAQLTRSQQPLVSALVRVLAEDGVADAERWATAIVRASPTDDLGYLALVTAQIRRESHFLAPDLEWLYQRLVPDLVHELGVTDPLRTLGPMQVQRWRLQDHFEQALGRELDAHSVKELAVDVEQGVAACVAVLDRLVVAHVPDRRLRGWIDTVGPAGLLPDPIVLARDWLGTLPGERADEALRQKLLGDLTAEPLALDGVRGAHTERLLAARRGSSASARSRRRDCIRASRTMHRWRSCSPTSTLGLARVAPPHCKRCWSTCSPSTWPPTASGGRARAPPPCR
jgi:hypothetical protein